MAALAGLDPAGAEEAVLRALVTIEEQFPDSVAAQGKVLPLVRDQRPKVRRKAVRVLAILQPDLDAKGVADVTRMLASADKSEVVDALKALRWLYVPSTIPTILPLLADSDEHVRREACRALAVIADRTVVAQIEPLLKDGTKDVRMDAEGAIAQLRNKP